MSRILSNDEIHTLTKKAFENNNLIAFLKGEDDYVCAFDRFVSADMPTDIGRVIQEGIYTVYEEDSKIIDFYRKAVIELLENSAVDVWLAYHICWTQKYKEINKLSPFEFFTDDILEKLKENVILYSDELKQIKKWQGAKLENGLFDDIQALEKTMRKHFGVSLL